MMFLLFGMALPVIAQESERGGEAGDFAIQTKPIPVQVTIEFKSNSCNSEVNVSYEQRNTIARVEGIVGSSSCPASSGEYTLAVGFRNESNESGLLEFVETWQRGDDEPLNFVNNYEIGENVDLTRIRVQNLRCTCTEAPTE
jgi:hypothetical protein